MGAYRFVGRDGVELACSETESGRPLILLHGFMGAGSHWLEQTKVDALAEQGYRIVLPDLRGHGESAKPHDPAAYPPDVLLTMGLRSSSILGSAMGTTTLVVTRSARGSWCVCSRGVPGRAGRSWPARDWAK
jgi:pimeloyl-ACP methyl ester carboxylesterase